MNKLLLLTAALASASLMSGCAYRVVGHRHPPVMVESPYYGVYRDRPDIHREGPRPYRYDERREYRRAPVYRRREVEGRRPVVAVPPQRRYEPPRSTAPSRVNRPVMPRERPSQPYVQSRPAAPRQPVLRNRSNERRREDRGRSEGRNERRSDERRRNQHRDERRNDRRGRRDEGQHRGWDRN